MARQNTRWMLIAVALLGTVAMRGGCGGCAAHRAQPDQVLARHLERLCEVARAGVDDPGTGVRRLLRYHGDHGPEMLEAFGALLVVIERVDDDDGHDARARTARDRLQAPVLACADTWQAFGDAVARDPDASALLERSATRLGRTLGILLGADQGRALTPLAWLRRLDLAPTARP